ncbi:MAG: tetratricopeptide repeat protein [Pirellulaceae bacterium]|nr:tetratricopeptide repeat protein [Pirellulaceae bacterium]
MKLPAEKFMALKLCGQLALALAMVASWAIPFANAQPTPDAAAQPASVPITEPLVARVEMRLTLGEKVIDTIEKGDLLTVVSEREDAYVIRTFNGHKGAVDKANAVKLAESIDIYNELIKDSDKEGRLYTMRASAWWALGEHDKALADYNQAIELGYKESHAFASRGIFQAATGHHKEAVSDFSAALEKDAKDAASMINRAAAYMALGEAEKAVEDYTSALKLDAKNSILLQQRAIARKAAGKLEEALADYDAAIEIEPKDVGAWMGRGLVYFQMGKHAGAIENFTHVISQAPQTATAYNNRGYNYQQLGKWREALDDYNKALELAPKYGLALQNKAWLLVLSGEKSLRDAPGAVAAAEAACQLTGFENVNDLLALAAALAADGQFDKAIGWQEKVIKLLPEADSGFAKKILERYQRKEPFDPKDLGP